MKNVVTSSEMKNLDLLTSKKFAIPLVLLMENAGAVIARKITDYIKSKKITNPKILIIAGPGNNGGDGIVTARHILSSIDNVSILLVVITKSRYQGDAKINYEIIKRIAKFDQRITIIENKLEVIKSYNANVTIDAIFGTGFKGAPQGIYKKVIEMINRVSGYRVAIDIPSGVNGDTGAVEGSAVKANLTITMGLMKRGHLLYPGKEYCGEVKVADLGISYKSLSKSNTFLIDTEFIKDNLPRRKPDGHKGTFGSVIVVAGGKGYSGAACLTSLGALVSGAGLVRLCFPENINTAVEKKLTEVIKVPLPATREGSLAFSGFNKIKEIYNQSTVMAIGPGVTTNSETKKLIQKAISLCKLSMVIDADGLNNMKLNFLYEIPKQKRLIMVLTPHPGEFERLFGIPSQEINRNRIEICRQWAKKLAITIVLKGAPTVIGTPDGNIYINPTGNSGLAKGGSGDVLTGMIAGFIAQSLKPQTAACLAVYLHGYAADIAVEDKTEYSLTASDLVKTLPKAIKTLVITDADIQ
jgi:NAD(P)H-hydrate epimerase